MFKYILLISFINVCLSQFLITNNGPCSCNFNSGFCETGCCCDPDCSNTQIQSFSCLNTLISPASYGCIPVEVLFGNNTSFNINNDGSQFCIYNDNYTLRNFYYAPTLSQFNASDHTPASVPVGYPSFDTNSAFIPSIYSFGSIIYTVRTGVFVGYMTISQSFQDGNCIDGVAIGYLRNELNNCQRIISNLSSDCANLPSTNVYYQPDVLVASFPQAMITPFSNSVNLNTTGNFTTPIFTCNPGPCNSSNPIYDNSICTNVVTGIIITITGESAITSVTIALTIDNINSSYIQTSQLIFNKIGYNSSIPQYSGNPGYMTSKAIISKYNNNTIGNWYIPTNGDCNNGSRTAILFANNIESDCSISITGLANPNTFINTTLSSFWPSFVAPFGNNVVFTSDWAPIIFENYNLSTGSVNTMSLIKKSSIYILYARNGTMTLPQNKIVGVKINNTYNDVAVNTSTIWISISLSFVDISQTSYDVNAAVVRLQSRSVRDFLYLLYVNNRASFPLVMIDLQLLLPIVILISGFIFYTI